MKFLGNVLATIVGLFVFLMLFVFGIILIAAIFSGDSDKVAVKSDSVIELKLENIKNDYAGKYKDPWVTIFSDEDKAGLSDIINAIEAAKIDDDIKGISFLNDESELGMAQRKALRDALEDFKKSGKFVMAYANSYSQKEYYLNSVANTIFINNANNFGISDLHQMRGRVGRSNKKAFCYFICPPYSAMTDDARKRIQALEQYSELGGGLNIAMKDLEIRGAGDLLGGEQSGFINEIVFETDQKIMNEAIDELK